MPPSCQQYTLFLQYKVMHKLILDVAFGKYWTPPGVKMKALWDTRQRASENTRSALSFCLCVYPSYDPIQACGLLL